MFLKAHFRVQCVHANATEHYIFCHIEDILADFSRLPRLCLPLQQHPPECILEIGVLARRNIPAGNHPKREQVT